MITVVLGPKTRLGQEVLTQRRDEPVLAVARDAADAAAVTGITGLAASQVVDASLGDLTDRVRAAGAGPVRLVVAALGPVHPVEPDFESDLAAVRRDLAFVGQVLTCGRQVEVVLISTVIALAPGADRRYYGGWKCLLEELLAQRAARHGGSLTVLYPGRLREPGPARPWHRLHASYERLARIALDPGLPADAGRTVGGDSRIWLAVRSVSFALRSLFTSMGRSRASKDAGQAKGVPFPGNQTQEQ